MYKKNSFLLFLISHFSFLILFLSCQTVPEIADASLLENTIPLNSGAQVYILADANEARPVINLLPINNLDNNQVQQMIDKTDFIAAAIFQNESGMRFQLVGWGNYPASGARLALGFNKYWKKHREPNLTYWHSDAFGISLALNSKQVFAASAAGGHVNPAALMPGVKTPESFNSFRRSNNKAILFFLFDDPAPFISRLLNNSGIPVNIPAEKVFISLFPAANNQYEAVIRMQFESASQARGIATILTLAANFMPLDNPGSMPASIMFANPPVQNNNIMDIKTALFNEDTLSLLFKSFLL